MLQRLTIQNYALISELDIEFSDQLSIITGETGAGKSIILGAMSLILGKRADANALHDKKKKCIIEGAFEIKDYQLKQFFQAEDLDYDHHTIIRREITPSGKSRAFVNDTPVKLTTLKLLTEQLVNVHAQHQSLLLNDHLYQLGIIDTLAGHKKELDNYQEIFYDYQDNRKQLSQLMNDKATLQQDLDFIAFQLNEFNEAELTTADEQENLEKEVKQLENAESIKKALVESIYIINEQDNSIIQQLDKAQEVLQENASYMPKLEELSYRLNSLNIELKDVAAELEGIEEDSSMNESRIHEIHARLNVFYKLQNKHRVKTLGDLLIIQENLANRSDNIGNLDERIQTLEKTIGEQKITLLKKAHKISLNRRKQIPIFEAKVGKLLKQMGMSNAKIRVYQTKYRSEELRVTGMDQIDFLFSANKGMPEISLRKVASGGELSRLVLAIKSLIADSKALPTLIFDEIDTGISGEVALKVGRIMEKLARKHQVICITHLPQIASKGNEHFFVYKNNAKRKTTSQVKRLSEEQRVVEIAKMLSGDKPGEMALANAQELLEA